MAPKNLPPASKDEPELDLIRSLANILDETGLSEIEMERKGVKLRVARSITAAVHAPVVHHAPASTAPAPG